MTREAFREAVFARDKRTCVMCPRPATAAHHIIERHLFPDGGYDIDNGVSVCDGHHLEAERTNITCETLREQAGIKRVVLPPGFLDLPGLRYDKWGNRVWPDGRHEKGPLFDQENVKKIMSPRMRALFA